MENHPGPSGTVYGLPARRKDVIAQISEAYAQDMLEQREFEIRLERAEAARTTEELDRLVADFKGARAVPSDTSVAPLPTRQYRVLGDQTHTLVPGRIEAHDGWSLLGDTVIDARAFRGSGCSLRIRVSGVVGDTRVLVPVGTVVVKKITTVVGDYRMVRGREPGAIKKLFVRLFGRNDAPPPSPFAHDGPPPTLILEGFRILGDIVIEESLS